MMTGMLLAVLAAASLSAWAQPAAPPPPAASEQGWGGMRHGMDGHGMRGHDMGRHEMGRHEMGGAMMFRGPPERVGRRVDVMLDGLNATDAQRTQIKQIAVATATDLKAQSQSGRALRQRAMQAFTAPTVDAAAVEQVRQQMLQQHDQMSRRVTQAMLDVARVLTPEQRTRLGERMRDRQARMEDRKARMAERMQHMQREQPPRR
ncbi:MAG: Spy/CpxP family protein refolding chaperone [Caldimonas sp.]